MTCPPSWPGCATASTTSTAALIHLLAERFKLTRTVGQFKAVHDLPPADPERESQQIERLRALSRQAQLDPVIARSTWTSWSPRWCATTEAIAQEHRARTGDV